MKKTRIELRSRLLSLLGWIIMSVIGRTVRLKTIGRKRVEELLRSGEGCIMALWHGRTFLPVYNCRGKGIWAITAISRDGELQTGILRRFGYHIIRGSSGRSGVKAGLAGCKKVKEGGVLSITPDGPLGPDREVQEGIVFIAQHADCPIMPVGSGVRTGLTLGAWDKYRLPLPFSKCAVVYGEPFRLCDAVSASTSSRPEDIIKHAISDVQKEAERLAGELISSD